MTIATGRPSVPSRVNNSFWGSPAAIEAYKGGEHGRAGRSIGGLVAGWPGMLAGHIAGGVESYFDPEMDTRIRQTEWGNRQAAQQRLNPDGTYQPESRNLLGDFDDNSDNDYSDATSDTGGWGSNF